MNAVLTVCNSFTKQSRDLPSPNYREYRDVIDLWTFEGDDMHVVVDNPPSSAYTVFLVTPEFVKDWSSVSNEWTTSTLYIDAFVAFSSLYYQGRLYVVRKWGSVMVAVLEKSELGAWE